MRRRLGLAALAMGAVLLAGSTLAQAAPPPWSGAGGKSTLLPGLANRLVISNRVGPSRPGPAIPEPTGAILFGAGFVATAAALRRRGR